jgi:hypothetical protein
MAVSPDDLRWAVAVAHSVPSVSLEVRFDSGGVVRTGHGDDQALFPICQFRQAAIEDLLSGGRRWAHGVASLRFSAFGLLDLGLGLYADRGCGGERRWFATFLDPAAVTAVLKDFPRDEQVGATVKGDSQLGVTLVVFETLHPSRSMQLNHVARTAVERCLVEELLAPSGADH